ncbi:MAG TPA: ABC-F family ATP-binding cassette domain-containing protein [Solirubrobacteraceae bacterium]|nr:ABC-F family ATP-binding cassette domain-containing protein [Solirubrobacteraceae bacterium]
MALLIASDLHKDMAGKPLLGSVSFKLERRERLTIAGRNGAGKTTLLRMIAGEDTIDRGELSVAKGVRIALHDQRPPLDSARDGGRGMSLRDYVLSGCAEELAVEQQLAKLEREMTAGGGEDALLDRYARAQARLESYGGYLWRDRATVMTHGLGFSQADLDRALGTFSGGQLTRASLARALATRADVLLLDEPTNHLDIESLEWLEQTLTGLDAAVMLVAHDRWFLEAVGTAVLELYGGVGGDPSRSRFFAGTWHAWRREQAAREIALGKAIDKQQAEIARMERFVERFRAKATKARQAQSRVKQLAKMERIERWPISDRSRDAATLEFAFKAPERTGRVIFEMVDGRVQIEGAGGLGEPIVLLDRAELWLERGEHVSLVGPNGAGKTTLIETLAGRRPLGAGKLSVGHNVSVGYLSQHAEDLGAGGAGGGPRQSVVEAAQRATGLSPNKARALVGRFLFSGEDAEKPLEGLSGGERRRLSLAILMNGTPRPPNVLILDEPTNHLDIESREALEDALSSFAGALLLVSHDRALLDAVGTRTVAIEDRSLRSYLGGWPEYVRIREERLALGAGGTDESDGGGKNQVPSARADADARGAADRNSHSPTATKPKAKKATQKGRGKADGPSKNRMREQDRAELAVEQAEAALQALEDELSDPAAWATKYEAAKSEARHTAARRAVEAAYEHLGALVD